MSFPKFTPVARKKLEFLLEKIVTRMTLQGRQTLIFGNVLTTSHLMYNFLLDSDVFIDTKLGGQFIL